MKVTIGQTDYELRLRMLACRNYQKATGKNLFADNALIEIFGNPDKSKFGSAKEDFNPELFLQFIHACLVDGAHPKTLELTIDELSVSQIVTDLSFQLELFKFFVKEKTGLSDEKFEELTKKIADEEKNPQATPAVATN